MEGCDALKGTNSLSLIDQPKATISDVVADHFLYTHHDSIDELYDSISHIMTDHILYNH